MTWVYHRISEIRSKSQITSRAAKAPHAARFPPPPRTALRAQSRGSEDRWSRTPRPRGSGDGLCACSRRWPGETGHVEVHGLLLATCFEQTVLFHPRNCKKKKGGSWYTNGGPWTLANTVCRSILSEHFMILCPPLFLLQLTTASQNCPKNQNYFTSSDPHHIIYTVIQIDTMGFWPKFWYFFGHIFQEAEEFHRFFWHSIWQSISVRSWWLRPGRRGEEEEEEEEKCWLNLTTLTSQVGTKASTSWIWCFPPARRNLKYQPRTNLSSWCDQVALAPLANNKAHMARSAQPAAMHSAVSSLAWVRVFFHKAIQTIRIQSRTLREKTIKKNTRWTNGMLGSFEMIQALWFWDLPCIMLVSGCLTFEAGLCRMTCQASRCWLKPRSLKHSSVAYAWGLARENWVNWVMRWVWAPLMKLTSGQEISMFSLKNGHGNCQYGEIGIVAESSKIMTNIPAGCLSNPRFDRFKIRLRQMSQYLQCFLTLFNVSKSVFCEIFNVEIGVSSSETQFLGLFSGASPCLRKRTSQLSCDLTHVHWQQHFPNATAMHGRIAKFCSSVVVSWHRWCARNSASRRTCSVGEKSKKIM